MDGNEQIDMGILMLEFVACCLYALSSLTLYFYLGVYEIFGGSPDVVNVCFIVSSALSFF
jgi:hypothetical protein